MREMIGYGQAQTGLAGEEDTDATGVCRSLIARYCGNRD